MFGGLNSNNEALSDIWKLNTSMIMPRWERMTQLNSLSKGGLLSYPQARYGHVIEQYYDYLLMFGGISFSEEQYLSDLWIYSIKQSKKTLLIKF